jgi:DNA-binding Lrp family transcriptional regulator
VPINRKTKTILSPSKLARYLLLQKKNMELQELRTLKILEEIDANGQISQRLLASKLNISLGLVNSFIKRLLLKGYFKMASVSKEGMKYIMTPEGASEKTRLTYRYIKYSVSLYKDTYSKLQKTFAEIESEGLRNLIFYGATELTEISLLAVSAYSINIVAIIDDFYDTNTYLDINVLKSKALSQLNYDAIIITSFVPINIITEQFDKHNLSQKKIITLI